MFGSSPPRMQDFSQVDQVSHYKSRDTLVRRSASYSQCLSSRQNDTWHNFLANGSVTVRHSFDDCCLFEHLCACLCAYEHAHGHV